MKTEVTVRIRTETETYQFARWVDVGDDGGEVCGIATEEEIAAQAERLGCDPELVGLMHFNFEALADVVLTDLRAVWKRQDELEKRLDRLISSVRLLLKR